MQSEPRTILVVEDEYCISEIVTEILAGSGYSVMVAINGKEGLDVLQHHRPDLILVDLMMPIMDGMQMIAHLRQDPALCSIPVVVTSAAHVQPPEGLATWQGVLYKPFDIDPLLEIVARLLPAESNN